MCTYRRSTTLTLFKLFCLIGLLSCMAELAPLPEATFQIDNRDCQIPCSVTFKANQADANYKWTFKGPQSLTTSAQQSPTIRFTAPGTYTALLVVSNAGGSVGSSQSITMTTGVRQYLNLAFSDMVYVPGGTFQMGDTWNEGDANEKPVRSVTVGPFWMGKYEVTQRQWKDVIGENAAYFNTCDDCPVEQVSWAEVNTFIQKLNTRTGGNYRLPTEAEWEYAAGSGSTTTRNRFGNGKDILDPNEVNFDADAFYKATFSLLGTTRGKTVQVGSFVANRLGLHDMTGNVWEWCSDWYGATYYASGVTVNPKGPETGTFRVLRGGGWTTIPTNCRITYRLVPDDGTFNKRYDVGFRLVSSVQ